MAEQRPLSTPRPDKRPIAWVVSSLFALAPIALADVAAAQSMDGLRSHVRITEWATSQLPQATGAQAAKEATQAQADEQRRLGEIDTAAGQAKLAAQAKRDEEARAQQAAQAMREDMLKAAQAREAQRLNEEARAAEAQRRAAADAQAEQQRVAREQAAARARAEQAQREAEEARRKALAEAEENRRLAEQARREAEEARQQAQKHAETMRRQVEAQAEAARQRDEQAKAEAEAARRGEEQRQQLAAQAKQAEAARQAEATRQAEAAQRAEAERVAAAEAKAKAEQQAQAAQAQRRQAELEAQQAREAEAAREAESKRTADAAHAQALLEAARENQKPAATTNRAAEPQPHKLPENASRELSRPVAGAAAPGQFAQWLETEPDTYGKGPTLSAAQLRQVFLDAVIRATDRSPEVRQAKANHLAADADVDEAKGQRWPQVDIGSQSPSASFGGNGRTGSNPLTVNVTTNVFDWGRTKNTIGSRERLSDAAKQAYRTAMENSGFEVSSTLIELGKQRSIVELSQQYVDRMATLVRMLSEIVQVDRGRGSELTQAKTRLLQAEAQRDSAEARVRDAELNLRKLVGDDDVMLPRTRQWAIEPGNLPELLSLAGVHPTLQQVRAEAEAADLNAQAVKASGRPQLNWVVTGGLNKDALGQRQGWQTMLSLNWGAFRGGSANAATAAATERAAASWQRLEQQQRDLEYAIRSADQDAHTMLQRADLYQGLSVETDKVRKAFFEQWYHLGKRTLLDVLTAESEHYGNRVAEVTNRFDGYLAVFREHHSAAGLVQWLQGPKAEEQP